MNLDEHKEAIAAACRETGVKRLDLFGSASGEKFRDSSDIDLVARFDRTPGKMFKRYFDLKERLEKLFGRPVDLVLEDSIKNPYFLEAVKKSRINIYES